MLEAEYLRGKKYAVRPAKQVGTCGGSPYAWTVIYVTARDAVEAVRKATPEADRQKNRYTMRMLEQMADAESVLLRARP